MSIFTGTSDVSVNVEGIYHRTMLSRSTPKLVHGRFGQLKPVPRNKGTKINFRRYESLAVATTPLTEGQPPTGKKLATTNINATLREYGDYVMLTNWLVDTGLDPVIAETKELLGEQMGLTADTIHRDILNAGTNVRYGNGVAARTSIVTALADTDIDSAIRLLEAADAKFVTDQVVAGTKYGTRAIPPAFYAIAHANHRQDIEALSNYKPREEYASQKGAQPEEIGARKNVRFLLTTNAKLWASGGGKVGDTGLLSTDAASVNVYSILVIAKDAYGIIPLARSNTKSIVKNDGGTSDPINQLRTAGWKMATVTKILNDNNMVRIESGATEL